MKQDSSILSMGYTFLLWDKIIPKKLELFWLDGVFIWNKFIMSMPEMCIDSETLHYKESLC